MDNVINVIGIGVSH